MVSSNLPSSSCTPISKLNEQRSGWSLERDLYTHPDSHQHDVDRVYAHSWLYAGHASRIPNPGDYFLYRIGQESLIIIKDENSAIHALFNVCRHRGSAICIEETGNNRRLICPYHQWVYKPDGSLLAARLMPPDFDKSGFGLQKAQVRLCEGLIFIHLTDGLPDFESFERQLTPRLQLYDLASAKVAQSKSYEVKANWKLVLENSRECYHCGKGHPQYCKAVGFAAAVDSAFVADQERAASPQWERRLVELGVENESIAYGPGTWFHARRFPLRAGFVSESMDGKPVAPLLGSVPNYEIGGFALVVLPNLLLEASPDYVMTLRMTPVSISQTEAEVQWLVRGDAKEGQDYDVAKLTEFWRLTSEQDWKLCEDNQAGVNSRSYRPGPYAPQERGVRHFTDWYLEKAAN